MLFSLTSPVIFGDMDQLTRFNFFVNVFKIPLFCSSSDKASFGSFCNLQLPFGSFCNLQLPFGILEIFLWFLQLHSIQCNGVFPLVVVAGPGVHVLAGSQPACGRELLAQQLLLASCILPQATVAASRRQYMDK